MYQVVGIGFLIQRVARVLFMDSTPRGRSLERLRGVFQAVRLGSETPKNAAIRTCEELVM